VTATLSAHAHELRDLVPCERSLAHDADSRAIDLDTTVWVGAFRPGGENWLRPDPGSRWISFADR